MPYELPVVRVVEKRVVVTVELLKILAACLSNEILHVKFMQVNVYSKLLIDFGHESYYKCCSIFRMNSLQ